MYKKLKTPIPFLVLALLFFSSNICLAQEQLSFSLNDEEVNQRTGISLDDYQQLDEVLLKWQNPANKQSSAFEEIRIFLARGARPVQMQKYMQPGNDLNITDLLHNARVGDRLVIEFLEDASSEAGEKSSQVATLALN